MRRVMIPGNDVAFSFGIKSARKGNRALFQYNYSITGAIIKFKTNLFKIS